MDTAVRRSIVLRSVRILAFCFHLIKFKIKTSKTSFRPLFFKFTTGNITVLRVRSDEEL